MLFLRNNIENQREKRDKKIINKEKNNYTDCFVLFVILPQNTVKLCRIVCKNAVFL